jgi:hypothetical protein
MASQPLAFGELLLGGVLVASAIKNEPLSEFVKHGLSGAAAPTAAEGAAATGTHVPGEGSDGDTTAEPESTAIAKGELLAPAPALKGGSEKQKLERYLNRKLTPKEDAELKRLEAG